MQFGKSLLGAILGAAVSIGLLIAAHFLLQRDNVWMAIPFALITGLGVRMMVSIAGHASYARGVMTMLVALAGYIGGMQAVTMIATAKANKPLPIPSVAATEPAEGEAKDEDTAETPAEAPKADQPAETPPRTNVAQSHPAPASGFSGSPWDVVWLAIAALVAYEMGRGTGVGVGAAPASQSTGAIPANTHPDA